MTKEDKKEKNMMSSIIAGIVVGLIMLIAQFFMHPLIAERTQARKQHMEQKLSVFQNANILIRKSLAANQITEPGKEFSASKLTEAPSSEQIMNVYSELLLVAEKQTIDKFLPFVPGWNKQVRNSERITLGDWLAFVNSARIELGFDTINLNNNQLVFVQDIAKKD
ncbi:MAG: hypothetical protein JXA96_18425 [Sedimentisphaerales bacterium]|nr:hypothetical protein [Sedimentisphaerales bacterium]